MFIVIVFGVLLIIGIAYVYKKVKAFNPYEEAEKAYGSRPEYKTLNEAEKAYNEAWDVLYATPAYEAYKKADEAVKATPEYKDWEKAYETRKEAKKAYFEALEATPKENKDCLQEMEEEAW